MNSFRDIAKYSILLILFISFSCGRSHDVKVIKLGHGLDVTHPVHKAMVYMGKRLAEKSGGTMRIDIYPNQQLGSERECLELLQIGSLGMTKVSSAVLENFVDEYKVFGLPYLFRDREHRFKVLNSKLGQKFLDYPLNKRLKGLAFYDAGSRSFYTKKKVQNPEDLNGLKIRVMESQTAIAMVNLLGGAATPIASGELYTAIQQGIVDGAENNPPTLYATREFELINYFLLDEHTAIPDVLIMSSSIWANFSDQEQKWIKQAARESAEYQYKLWREAEVEALQKIKNSGVKIIVPDKKSFKDAVAEIYDRFEKKETYRHIIREIQQME